MDAKTYRKCATDYFAPNHAQLSKAIKGNDPNYRIGANSLWKSYAVLIGILLFAIFGSIAVVALVAK